MWYSRDLYKSGDHGNYEFHVMITSFTPHITKRFNSLLIYWISIGYTWYWAWSQISSSLPHSHRRFGVSVHQPYQSIRILEIFGSFKKQVIIILYFIKEKYIIWTRGILHHHVWRLSIEYQVPRILKQEVLETNFDKPRHNCSGHPKKGTLSLFPSDLD